MYTPYLFFYKLNFKIKTLYNQVGKKPHIILGVSTQPAWESFVIPSSSSVSHHSGGALCVDHLSTQATHMISTVPL